MFVLNTTPRDIFFGAKSRELQDIEEVRRGLVFPAGVAVEVPDRLSFNSEFELLRSSGSLTVTSYDPNQDSVVTHAETKGLGALVEDSFIPTTGQTFFVLSALYIAGGFVRASVNGVNYETPVDFIISGSTFIWLDAEFSLDSSDELVVQFET